MPSLWQRLPRHISILLFSAEEIFLVACSLFGSLLTEKNRIGRGGSDEWSIYQQRIN